MPLTKAQRRTINARNAQASTGPHNTARTRFNALKHGLRAEVLGLPDENPELIQQRADAWNDYYQPQDPAEQHLVNECVRATLLSDRVDRFQSAELAQQIRHAGPNWDFTQIDRREHDLNLLTEDPARAVRDLKRFGFGVQHLIEAWERLDQALVETGSWNELERDEAIRLLGYSPAPKTLKQTPVAWITRLYNLVCRPNALESAFTWLFDPSRVPDLYRSQYAVDFHPEAETCRRSLRAMIAEELEPLREAAAELQTEIDDPDSAEAGDRALILRDETTARLFLRYHAEARTSFQRAYAALVQTMAARAEEPIPMVELPASPTEADRVEEPALASVATGPCDAVEDPLAVASESLSPNEAKPVVGVSLTTCEPSTSVKPEAKKSKAGKGRRKEYDPKEDVGAVLLELLYQEKVAAERLEVVPIAAVGAGS